MNDDLPFIISWWEDTESLYGTLDRSVNSLTNLIKDFSVDSLIVEFSLLMNKINCSNDMLGYEEILKYLNRTEKRRLLTTNDYQTSPFIHKQQLYTAMRIAFKYAVGTETITDQNRHLIGKFLLEINSFSEEILKSRDESNEMIRTNNMTADLIPSYLISTLLKPGNLFTQQALGREYFRYVKYWEDNPEDNDLVLLERDFQQITGIKIKDYFSSLFALGVPIMNNNPSKIYINLPTFFSSIKRTDFLPVITKRFCMKEKDYSEQWSDEQEDLATLLTPQFTPLIQYPLCLRADNDAIILDKSLLGLKILEDPYWILENYYLEVNKMKKWRLVPAVFGRLWQEYVVTQIKTNLTKDIQLLDIEEEHLDLKKADILIEREDCTLIIELKHLIFSINTKSGNLTAFDNDCNKIFGEEHGLVQIDETIKTLSLQNSKKTIYRILIVDEKIPQNFIFFKHYEDTYNHWTPPYPNCSYPIIICKDELEQLVTIGIENFVRLLKLRDYELRNKGENGFVYDKNSLTTLDTLQRNPELSKHLKINRYSQGLYDLYTTYTREILFPERR
ncbi:MAG: hypothetical protein KBH94_06370 [Caldisericia bacterium]|nr:hypothetical protein [Caldisericia bacterium]